MIAVTSVIKIFTVFTDLMNRDDKFQRKLYQRPTAQSYSKKIGRLSGDKTLSLREKWHKSDLSDQI